MKRLLLTQQSLRCPVYDYTANLTVRTDPDGYPSRRHLDVTACSLLPATSFVPPTRRRHFADMAPPIGYLEEVDRTPCHSTDVVCPKRCLSMLNAAECGAAEPVRCGSGVSDGLELARQIHNPAIVRLMWYHGA
jgi:hypothetical protein